MIESEATNNREARREHCTVPRLILSLHLVVVEGGQSTIDMSRIVALEGRDI